MFLLFVLESIQQHLFGLHQVSCTLIWLQVFRFLGGTIFAWFDAFFNTFGPSLTKIVYACFDGSSHQRTCLQITRQHRKIKKHVMLERSHATKGRFQQLFVFLQRHLFSAVQVSELISGNAFFPVHHQIESEHL